MVTSVTPYAFRYNRAGSVGHRAVFTADVSVVFSRTQSCERGHRAEVSAPESFNSDIDDQHEYGKHPGWYIAVKREKRDIGLVVAIFSASACEHNGNNN